MRGESAIDGYRELGECGEFGSRRLRGNRNQRIVWRMQENRESANSGILADAGEIGKSADTGSSSECKKFINRRMWGI